ncbi:MAG: helicase-related protein [Acidimicrobiaceae bacterium]|nr:helicase-related protein [Acidimicrobiaceae bacterium]
MAGRPYLLDNLSDGTRHADALTYLLGDVAARHGLSIASGYVNLGGLHHVATTVSDDRKTRLLLGVAPEPGLGHQLPVSRFELALEGLRADRDLARFPPSRAATKLVALDAWLDRPNVEVRRYTSQFLHGKAYLFGNQDDARAALVTSANLTGAGLFSNLELGLVQYDPPVAQQAVAWFDCLWDSAEEFKHELRGLLFPEVGLLSPRDIYLRALLELLDPEDEQAEGPTPTAVELASFQRDGFRRALGILERHHGVIYADGVGTGKTEIGVALIEEYALRRGVHALAVAPAQLVDYWKQKLDQARVPAQVISYHQLANDEQLASPGTPSTRRYLHSDKDAYRLVVMDEGHALRTPGTTWYRAVSRLLGGRQKDLALLTATPINNGLWDLYHLVMTFAHHDRAFASHGIPSLRRLFLRAGANERDPENLNPDVLFSLADMVSVRRDRRFIELHYPNETFPDGTPVSFPAPELSTERYDLDTAYPGLVRTITTHIASLSMARYRPSSYRLDREETRQEAVLSALLQSAVLKRFESCWNACLLTLDRMINAHTVFLDSWDQGKVLSGDALREAAVLDLDETGLAEWAEENLDETDVESADRFDPNFREEVLNDRRRLVATAEALRELSAKNDPKLDLLKRLLEGVPSEKVIIFSAFADTVRYLDEHLPDPINGRDRVTVVGAETSPDERTRMLARFCPESVVDPGYVPLDGEVDLLLSNDVLSEGQNLQQAAAVISYDMPWNPQRVVQRYGRVVRLKSPHPSVFLVTMLPEQGDLEMILQLETAIRRKIVAAQPYGMEIEVVEGLADEEIQAYARRLTSGDASLLDEADTPDGPHALSAELLRAELRRAAGEGEIDRVNDLPWGVGAAFAQGPGVPSTGPPGVFFACRMLDGQRHWRFVTDEGDIASAPPTLLRRINPGLTAGLDDPPIDLDTAWSIAAASIIEEHEQETDIGTNDKSLGPIQRWARALLTNPSISTPPNASEAYEALGVERGSQVRQGLGTIRRNLSNEVIDITQAAQGIVDTVAFYGLRPVDPPTPPGSITEEDIGVVCWMAVLPEPD